MVQSGHTIVVYEVALSLSRLIRTHSEHLHQTEWECIYDIMLAIQEHMIQQQKAAGSETQQALSSNNLGQCLREMFLTIETLYERGVNIGAPEKFFELVEGSINTISVSMCCILDCLFCIYGIILVCVLILSCSVAIFCPDPDVI